MRIIKFRGRHLCGQWYYGNLIVRETDSPVPETPLAYKCVYIGDIEDGSGEQVEEETIGQFTGLLDKNGKEIYEGDLVKYTRYKFRSEYLKKDVIEEVYTVYWNEEKHAFYCTTKFESGGGASGYLDFHDERAEKEEIEVIGNIHDNPELLKGGNYE